MFIEPIAITDKPTQPTAPKLVAFPAAATAAHGVDEELLSILRGKLHREQLTAGVDALMAAATVLRKKRATASHFGNGGEVANLLSEAKLRKENRRGDDTVESRQAKNVARHGEGDDVVNLWTIVARKDSPPRH